MSVKQNFPTFNPPNLKQQSMVNTRPQPSVPISLRMYVLVVMAMRKDPVTWDTDFSGGLIGRGHAMRSLFRPFGKHLDDFGSINMLVLPQRSEGGNGRIGVYPDYFGNPLLGRFLSPDNHIQSPDNPQNYNRYAYALNNPLVYTDPSGEFLGIAIGIGALVGAYIGGSSANAWQLNPGKWDWNGDTWAGIGLGAVIGGAAGLGAYYAGPALANTAFFSHFGTSGTIAAYTLTGAAAGGIAGYGAGFSGGMLYSNGDWGYSHQSGMLGAKGGATVGSVIGAAYGLLSPEGRESISDMFSSPPTLNIQMPERPKWDGRYFQGTKEDAKEMLLSSSKIFNVETSYWYTSKGYYFAPIQGEAYGYTFDHVTLTATNYNISIGYQFNNIGSTKRYTYVERLDGNLYLHPNFSQRAAVYYKAHTHPSNGTESPDDLLFSRIFGIRCTVFGWNGVEYNYGGPGYWK